MTDALDSRRTAEWDWVVTTTWKVLHAPKVWDDPDYNASCEGVTACGIKAWLCIPGIFTRMGASRCKRCCRITGMPEGDGSPKNDDLCRPVVEARLAQFERVIKLITR